MLNLELLNTQDGRKKVIQYIESNDNLGRKNESFKQSEIYKDRIGQYVLEELRSQFSEQTVSEMPLVKSVNIAKRCVNNQAIIYQQAPERTFLGVTEQAAEVLWNVYHDLGANKKLGWVNRFYKLQKQDLLQVIPKEGKLIARVLQPHQWDAIASDSDPEKAEAIIVSAFDKTQSFQENLKTPATGRTSIATQGTRNYQENLDMMEQERQKNKQYVVWTREINFIMNGLGEVVGEVLPNPIGELPFVEISEQKDYEYWVRQASAYTDFTIEFNAAMTETRQTVKMQSFAVAIVKAPKEMKFNNLQIGPNYVLHLPLDEVNGVKTEFEFASPSANIDGSIKFLEVMLSGFLSANGVDPKTVSMSGESATFTSGLDRLLSLIDKMQASKDDFDLFQKVETELFELIKKWLNVLNGTQSIDAKYQVTIPEDAEVTVKFYEPTMVQTEQDRLDMWSRKIEMGLASEIHALMELENLSREQAEEKLLEVRGVSTLEMNLSTSIDQQSQATTDPSIQDKVLNGAQVSSLVGIVEKVAAGLIPRDAAVRIVEVAFQLPTEDADKLIASAGKGFRVQSEAEIQPQ